MDAVGLVHIVGWCGSRAVLTARLARVLALLATASQDPPQPVRILFYGQSITTSSWTDRVVKELQARHPKVRIIAENRALGGFSSQLLVRTMEADVFAFHPDLFILQVYGSHVAYEDIITAVRRRTTADILMLNDHVGAAGVESIDGKTFDDWSWDQQMNRRLLPEIADRYGCALLDIRTAWLAHLASHRLEPRALLKDEIHLNEPGEALMATLVADALRIPKRWTPPADDRRIRVVTITRDRDWRNGKLILPFHGSRIEMLGSPLGFRAAVLVDGRPPSAWEGSFIATRTSGTPAIGWPAIKWIGHTAPWLVEDWTASCSAFTDDQKDFSFEVRGSRTGRDGIGRAAQRFASKSGRVVIDPEDWTFAYDKDTGKKSAPDGFEVNWKIQMLGTDRLENDLIMDIPPPPEWTVLAHGLPNAPHMLTLTAESDPPERMFLRIHRPPESNAP